ncbi:hypothetical protein [Staphylococcus haemolyticus]|uniref:hypothetical protein n=1 Tax=Staphylococcus haemolyticus TaxID=1283 RepID=UPI0020C78432|nr:hypothetical protein [Staphylococcus haemolyticus]
MAEITKERLLKFIRNNDLDLDESYPRSDWWKFRNERDSFRKQRDELINDLAEVKRKAKAFDEILNVDYIVATDDYAHEITKIVDKYKEEQ